MAAMLATAFVSCGGVDPDDPDTPAGPASVIPDGAIVIADFTKSADKPSNVTLPGWGYVGTFKSDATYAHYLDLTVDTAGQYPTMDIAFSTPVDLSGKTIYMIAKGKKSNALKIVLYSDASEDNQHANEYLPFANDVTEWKTLEQKTVETWASWDNSKKAEGEAADMTKISTIKFMFQEEDQSFQIAAIYAK